MRLVQNGEQNNNEKQGVTKKVKHAFRMNNKEKGHAHLERGFLIQQVY